MFANSFDRFCRRFFDTPGDPGPGGGGGTPNPAPVVPAVAPAPGSAAPGGPPAGTPPVDDFDARFQARAKAEGWMPRHVGTRMAQSRQQLEMQLNQERERIRALTGVTAPPDPAEQELRTGLAKLFPWMDRFEKLPEEKRNRMFDALESGDFDSLFTMRDQGYQKDAQRAGRAALEGWAELTGQDINAISPKAQQRLSNQLRDFILEDETGARERQYYAQDEKLIKDFLEDLDGFYVKPLRQTARAETVVNAAAVRRLPSSGPRSGPPAQQQQRPTRQERSQAARAAVANHFPDE